MESYAELSVIANEINKSLYRSRTLPQHVLRQKTAPSTFTSTSALGTPAVVLEEEGDEEAEVAEEAGNAEYGHAGDMDSDDDRGDDLDDLQEEAAITGPEEGHNELMSKSGNRKCIILEAFY